MTMAFIIILNSFRLSLRLLDAIAHIASHTERDLKSNRSWHGLQYGKMAYGHFILCDDITLLLCHD